MSKKYEASGVNLERGYEAISLIKNHAQSTIRKGSMGSIGTFGGMFDLGALNYQHPVLVSGADGVGTKLKIAVEMNRHDTIGNDVVAMCVNDVVSHGAEPLYFLDYLAFEQINPEIVESIISGISSACKHTNCALIGGETAEMPEIYAKNEYDVAGFSVGIVEKANIIDGCKVKRGDVLIGLSSSGVHANGFSLIRKIIKDNNLNLNEKYPETDNKTLGEILLTPTTLYVNPILKLIKEIEVHGIAHITGGGFDENIPRIIKEGLYAEIDEGSWEIPPIFVFLEKYGKIPHREMFNIFNMGIGMVLSVDEKNATKVISVMESFGIASSMIGNIKEGNKKNKIEIRQFK